MAALIVQIAGIFSYRGGNGNQTVKALDYEYPLFCSSANNSSSASYGDPPHTLNK